MVKLTTVFDDETGAWLRDFAARHNKSMGEVIRTEVEALRLNDMASAVFTEALGTATPVAAP